MRPPRELKIRRLENLELRVRITHQLKLRVWVATQLIRLASWVLSGRLSIDVLKDGEELVE